MSLFEVQNIGFSQNGKTIVDDVSVKIEKGSVTGFLGKSGCGKTTLIKLISGILVPTAGKSLFEGQDIQTMNKAKNLAFRKKCSFVFQDSALWANQDILQNMILPLKIHYPEMSVDDMKACIQIMLAKVNFRRSLNLRPADLSAGEQKKIAFARAMITEPETLFLDEVTAALDLSGCDLIYEILNEFLGNGNTIIYVSHNNDFIKNFKGTLHVIEDGKLQTTRKGGRTDIDKLMDKIDGDSEDNENVNENINENIK